MPLAVGIPDKRSGTQLDSDVVDTLERVLAERGLRIAGSTEPMTIAS